ncbi:hypothetical protein HY489_03665 [Candidatus Woesearchaeota archaeon]|nr:hypothetical protein [Candidatus Woesearchaeota archaeon]
MGSDKGASALLLESGARYATFGEFIVALKFEDIDAYSLHARLTECSQGANSARELDYRNVRKVLSPDLRETFDDLRESCLVHARYGLRIRVDRSTSCVGVYLWDLPDVRSPGAVYVLGGVVREQFDLPDPVDFGFSDETLADFVGKKEDAVRLMNIVDVFMAVLGSDKFREEQVARERYLGQVMNRYDEQLSDKLKLRISGSNR